ncbi:MAG: DUF1513 domain-containing protein [Burkholderiaceae bacterium]|nr:DUF1513 domain-containing protein [Burkholderiaceae bacterium]
MDRRQSLHRLGRAAAGLAGSWLLPLPARTQPASAALRLALAWRGPDDGGQLCDQAGVLRLDGDGQHLALEAAATLPGRAHGLLALADGGFVVCANRPGRWLARFDGHGRLQTLLALDAERPARTLNGHLEADADGRWLFSTETDVRSGEGWISVRDAATLRRVAQWPSQGIDPHQLLLDAEGGLLVAHGGIARDAQGRKRAGEPLLASLQRLDARNGRELGRWTLADAELSIRHMAWGQAPDGGAGPWLGLALQAEHGQVQRRQDAPLLALWDGRALLLPPGAAPAAVQGYAGDIAATPEGGFVLSGQKAGLGLWWRPLPAQPAQLSQPEGRWQRMAELQELCGLAQVPQTVLPADSAWAGGVLLAAARGLAWWQAGQPARAWPWPRPLVPDNHLVLLEG